MPKLTDHEATTSMHCIGNDLPGSNVFWRVHAWDIEEVASLQSLVNIIILGRHWESKGMGGE